MSSLPHHALRSWVLLIGMAILPGTPLAVLAQNEASADSAPETVPVPAEAEQTEPAASEAATPQASAGPSELPQPVTADHFSAIRSQSPFLRTLNLAETYSLRGVAEIGGTPVATLYNRDTKKTITVTKDQANAEGITMVEVVPARDLNGVAVKVSLGGEVIELKYETQQLSPTASGKANGGKGGDSKGGGDSKRRGPSKQDMERYNSLTDAQKEKFRDYARQTMQKYPNLSREERGNMIRGALSRLSDTGELPASAPQPSGDR